MTTRTPQAQTRNSYHRDWGELHHTEQSEAASIGGLILGLLALLLTRSWEGFGTLFLCWITMPRLAYVGGLIAAWLRGEDPYRGNHLEESARATTQK
jgi:hypothetical protein